MKYTPRLPDETANVTPSGPLRTVALLGGGAVAVLFVVMLVYALLGAAVDWIVPHISLEMEQKIGAYALKKKRGIDRDSLQERVLQTMMNELYSRKCIDLGYRPTVHYVFSYRDNAVALPGGYIVVYGGLIRHLESLNEVVFVLGHEAGHFKHRDSLRGLGRRLIIMAMSVAVFGGDSRVGEILSGWLNLADLKFSRQQETLADEYGLEVLNCRFGHVGGAEKFFEDWAAWELPGGMSRYFSTHPPSRDRIAHLAAYSREKGYSKAPLTPMPKLLRHKPKRKK